jgi:hypothetical protein
MTLIKTIRTYSNDNDTTQASIRPARRHAPALCNIPDVKKQLKLDYEASSSINIK